MKTHEEHRDRIAGGLIGMLVGDALGVPYEFHAKKEIPKLEIGAVNMTPPRELEWRAHGGTPSGTWSDDGAMALCLLETLIVKDFVDTRDLADRFLAWKNTGHMAVDGRVFDIGGTTSSALACIARGTDPLAAGLDHESSCGNGSLMRTLPVALWAICRQRKGKPVDVIDVVTAAHLQGKITHAHPRCQVACAWYTLAAIAHYDESPSPFGHTFELLASVYTSERFRGLPYADMLAAVNLYTDSAPTRGTGYVLDSLAASTWLVARGNAKGCYEQAILDAIALGDDTDTTACCVGGLAGLRYGLKAIPSRWVDALRGRDIFAPMLDALLVNA